MERRHRDDFGPSLLCTRCTECRLSVFNRGCAACNVCLCRGCFANHACDVFQSRSEGTRHEYDYFFKLLLVGESGVGKSAILTRFADGKFRDVYAVDFKAVSLRHQGKTTKLPIWDSAGEEIFRSYYRGAQGVFIVYDVADRYSFTMVKEYLEQVEKYAPQHPAVVLIASKCDEIFLRMLTANIYIQSGKVRVCTTNLAATLDEECILPMEAPISEFEDDILHKFKLSRVDFLSGDGSIIKKSDHLKDHSVLTLKGFSVPRAVTYEEGKELADSLGMPFLEVCAKKGINIDAAFDLIVRDIKHRVRMAYRADHAQSYHRPCRINHTVSSLGAGYA